MLKNDFQVCYIRLQQLNRYVNMEHFMDVLRTPEERFAKIPHLPYQSKYLEVEDSTLGPLRIHYFDSGNPNAHPVLMLHGEPSWGFLYRKVMNQLIEAGYRVIVPDLVGFGRSDKPCAANEYTYGKHIYWMLSFLAKLNLKPMSLLCQDWGGLIGLRLVSMKPDWFSAIVAANTFLPTGNEKISEAFLQWREYSQCVPEFKISKVIQKGCLKELSPEILAAYDAPFPNESYKVGARTFPTLVPITPDDPEAVMNREAWQVLSQWQKPCLTAFSDNDPITRGADRLIQKLIPGCKGQDHVTLEGGGHFLQEDCGVELGNSVAVFLKKNKIS